MRAYLLARVVENQPPLVLEYEYDNYGKPQEPIKIKVTLEVVSGEQSLEDYRAELKKLRSK